MELLNRNKRLTALLTLFLVLLGIAIFFTWPRIVLGENTNFLDDKLPKRKGRYYTLLRSMDWMNENKAKVLVETGTARCGIAKAKGDGASTVVFGQWAHKNSAKLYSVDIDPVALQNAERDLGPCRDHVELVLQDSIAFLRDFDQPIDFLYLDSYDYDVNDPLPSQLHHLKEIQAALPKLHEKSAILIDDCKLPGGGKGKLVIPYLLENGWKIEKDAYQVLLVRQ